MAKPLKTLRRQFLQQGLHLLFSFDTSVAPGTIINMPKPRDVNNMGSIEKFPGARPLSVLGPVDVGLTDFSRVHELTVDAAAELLEGAGVAPKLKRAKTIRLALDRPRKWFIEDKIELFSKLVGDPSWPKSAQAAALAQKDHFLVTEVVRTKLRYTFHGRGEVALSASDTGLGSLAAVKLNTGYKWENDFELVAKRELVVAFEAVRWAAKKKTFQILKA